MTLTIDSYMNHMLVDWPEVAIRDADASCGVQDGEIVVPGAIWGT